MTIAREEAFAILARDLSKYEARTSNALAVSTDQAVFDGAVSFDFNTGAIDRASWVAAFRAGDRTLARKRLMLWTKAGGRIVAGLVQRREAEARLIFEGSYGGSTGSTSSAEITGLQRGLAALGFYRGPVDGIAGSATSAAVIAYQKSHPDLVADGVAGPATKASIARDIDLRQKAKAGGVVAATTAIVAGAEAASAGGVSPLLFAAIAGAAVLIALGIFLALRYRGELNRALRPTRSLT